MYLNRKRGRAAAGSTFPTSFMFCFTAIFQRNNEKENTQAFSAYLGNAGKCDSA